MIDLNKKYKTRDGREARILATDLGGARPVVAAITYSEGEFVYTYNSEGQFASYPSSQDLLEVKPVFTRWIIARSHHGYDSKAAAQQAGAYLEGYAIVPITFSHGDGLEE